LMKGIIFTPFRGVLPATLPAFFPIPLIDDDPAAWFQIMMKPKPDCLRRRRGSRAGLNLRGGRSAM
jgi:hypothetical protein